MLACASAFWSWQRLPRFFRLALPPLSARPARSRVDSNLGRIVTRAGRCSLGPSAKERAHSFGPRFRRAPQTARMITSSPRRPLIQVPFGLLHKDATHEPCEMRGVVQSSEGRVVVQELADVEKLADEQIRCAATVGTPPCIMPICFSTGAARDSNRHSRKRSSAATGPHEALG
jgi:hypothetical protein